MANKKIFTDESLATLVDETKSYVDNAVSTKADKNHNHNDIYETKEDAQVKYDTIVEAKADWNQNDETAIDYVKNRPFYEYYEAGKVVVEKTVVSSNSGEIYDNEHYAYVHSEMLEFVENSTYEVMYDDAAYIVNCTFVDGVPRLGEVASDGSPLFDKYPFAMMYADTYNMLQIATKDTTPTEHSIRITSVTQKVQQLNEQYLPDTTKYQGDWNQNDEEALDFIKNRPFYSKIFNITLIDNQTLTSVSMTDENPEPYEIYFEDNTKFIDDGDECIVIFDGVEYVVNAFDMMYAVPMGLGGYRKRILLGEYDLEEYRPIFNKYPFNIMLMLSGDNADSCSYASVMVANNEDSIKEHTVTIIHKQEQVTELDEKFIPNNLKAGRNVAGKEFHEYDYDADKEVSYIAESNAEIFNNYENNMAIGKYSHAEGSDTKATGDYSHAEGYKTNATAMISHAEGYNTKATGSYSHAEGYETEASASYTHAEGYQAKATARYSHAEGFATESSGEMSHAEGDNAIASGQGAHAEGYSTKASGDYSHAEGSSTIAASPRQHVQGRYNIEDAEGKYAHIVGNGDSNSTRSNAHTLDWSGNAWYQGSVEATALILKSPNGTRFSITIGDDGVLSATEITA